MSTSALRFVSRAAGILVLLLESSLAHAQTTYWVDDGGNDSNDGLSSQAAWKHLYFAVTQVAPGDTIKVLPGTYNVAGNQEVFPIPVPNDVRIIGSESALASWPRFGGDINSTTVKELFIIDATSSDLTDVQLDRLYFLAEDSSGRDAPACVRVKVDEGKNIVRSGISNCYFERSKMNQSGANGNPCVSLELGDPTETNFTVSDSTFFATERGGIEVKPLPTGEGQGDFTIDICGCEVKITGSNVAEFGIRVGGGTGQAEGASWTAGVKIRETTIDSMNVTTPGTHGIKTGIDYYTYAEDGKLIRLLSSSNMVTRCEVKGCSGDGIRLWVDSDEQTGSITNVVNTLNYNYLHDNGDGSFTDGDIGAGLRVRWGSPGTPWNTIGYLGYITPVAGSCMIVDNDIGVLYEGFDPDSLTGGGLINCTIAGNVGPGIRFDGTFADAPAYSPAPDSIDNMIVWGNNGGGSYAQYDGTAGWIPGTQSMLKYSCWMNLSGLPTCSSPDSNGNVAVDPNFVNAAGGNYKVTPTGSACVVDKGYNFTDGLPEFDFELDARTIDGLQDGGRQVDMGADEHDP